MWTNAFAHISGVVNSFFMDPFTYFFPEQTQNVQIFMYTLNGTGKFKRMSNRVLQHKVKPNTEIVRKDCNLLCDPLVACFMDQHASTRR